MPKKICSNGNRRPIRYENWNGAIAIRYDGNIALIHIIWKNKEKKYYIDAGANQFSSVSNSVYNAFTENVILYSIWFSRLFVYRIQSSLSKSIVKPEFPAHLNFTNKLLSLYLYLFFRYESSYLKAFILHEWAELLTKNFSNDMTSLFIVEVEQIYWNHFYGRSLDEKLFSFLSSLLDKGIFKWICFQGNRILNIRKFFLSELTTAVGSSL